jgi:internalin A
MKSIKNIMKIAPLVVIFGLLAVTLFPCILTSQEGAMESMGLEVDFPDPNLELAIRKAINKPEGPIYVEDLEGLDELYARGRGIADLTGLEYCTDLEELWLDDNKINRVSPLWGFTKLENLWLEYNEISDISPLSGLTNLTEHHLAHNQISDIKPLVDNVDSCPQRDKLRSHP